MTTHALGAVPLPKATNSKLPRWTARREAAAKGAACEWELDSIALCSSLQLVLTHWGVFTPWVSGVSCSFSNHGFRICLSWFVNRSCTLYKWIEYCQVPSVIVSISIIIRPTVVVDVNAGTRLSIAGSPAAPVDSALGWKSYAELAVSSNERDQKRIVRSQREMGWLGFQAPKMCGWT